MRCVWIILPGCAVNTLYEMNISAVPTGISSMWVTSTAPLNGLSTAQLSLYRTGSPQGDKKCVTTHSAKVWYTLSECLIQYGVKRAGCIYLLEAMCTAADWKEPEQKNHWHNNGPLTNFISKAITKTLSLWSQPLSSQSPNTVSRQGRTFCVVIGNVKHLHIVLLIFHWCFLERTHSEHVMIVVRLDSFSQEVWKGRVCAVIRVTLCQINMFWRHILRQNMSLLTLRTLAILSSQHNCSRYFYSYVKMIQHSAIICSSHCTASHVERIQNKARSSWHQELWVKWSKEAKRKGQWIFAAFLSGLCQLSQLWFPYQYLSDTE